jgi:hypothetical protein
MPLGYLLQSFQIFSVSLEQNSLGETYPSKIDKVDSKNVTPSLFHHILG